MFPDILSENNYRSILSGVFDGIKTTKIIIVCATIIVVVLATTIIISHLI